MGISVKKIEGKIRSESHELFEMFKIVLAGKITKVTPMADREALEEAIEQHLSDGGDNERHSIGFRARSGPYNPQGAADFKALIKSIAHATEVLEINESENGNAELVGRDPETVKRGLIALGRNLHIIGLPKDHFKKAKKLFDSHQESQRGR